MLVKLVCLLEEAKQKPFAFIEIHKCIVAMKCLALLIFVQSNLQCRRFLDDGARVCSKPTSDRCLPQSKYCANAHHNTRNANDTDVSRLYHVNRGLLLPNESIKLIETSKYLSMARATCKINSK